MFCGLSCSYIDFVYFLHQGGNASFKKLVGNYSLLSYFLKD